MLAITREVDFLLPSSSPSTVDISTILPADAVTTYYQFASSAVVDAALALVAATDADLNARMDLIDLSAAVVTAAVVIHPFMTMGA